MDIETAQDMIINWIGQAPWDVKYNFMRSLFGAVPENEAKTFGNMFNKTRRVSKRKRFEEQIESSPKIQRTRVESVPLEPVPPKPKSWFSKYEASDIVAIDCEHVHYIDEKGRQRVKAATVSIVNYSGKEIYAAKIYHRRNSFIVNRHTRDINGFKADTFDDLRTCKPMFTVMEEVNSYLSNKLIITHSGATDFESLNLNAGDYDHFDVAEYYKRPQLNKFGEDIGEKISLRSLYYYFFEEDIQLGTHSPFKDARGTMKLFRKKYMPANSETEDRFYTNYSFISKCP